VTYVRKSEITPLVSSRVLKKIRERKEIWRGHPVPKPLMVGIRSPDGLVVGPCTSPLEFFGFDSQTRGTRENRAPPCVKVPGSSRVPPLMVGIRSPDGLVVGPCTSHPGVLGSIPKREEPVKTGRHPVLQYRVPHGSHGS
jgi:hypothetical protein